MMNVINRPSFLSSLIPSSSPNQCLVESIDEKNNISRFRYLIKTGKEDEAFYFEMLKEYVKDGGELDPSNASRALGL